MKYGYMENRKMREEDLRSLCVTKKWYTGGNCEEYDSLLKTASSYSNITSDELVEIASDISSHSETDQSIESIMHELSRICYSLFHEI